MTGEEMTCLAQEARDVLQMVIWRKGLRFLAMATELPEDVLRSAANGASLPLVTARRIMSWLNERTRD